MLRDDWISIDDIDYKIADLDRIPDKYKVNLGPNTAGNTDQPTARKEDGAVFQLPPRPQKNVKIRMTRAGLCFSGPTAYLSHMHKCIFVYKKVPYSSVEQGYHHQHAIFEEELEIAKKIMSIHDPYDIKDAAASLPKSEGWSAIYLDEMWGLNVAKYDQNPELKRQLISTAPTTLIEASIDSKWGGGLPLHLGHI